MANIALADVVEVRIYCADAEQASVNTYYLVCTAITGAGVSDLELANNLDANVGLGFKPLLYNSASYRGMSVQDITAVPKRAQVFASASAGVGTAGAVGLPRQTSGLLSFRDGYAGRGGRGRLYIPFPASASNELIGTPTAAYQTTLDTLKNGIAAGANVVGGTGTAQFTHCLYHRKTKTTTFVNFYDVSQKWGTQRRRGSYGKANSSPI